MFSSLFPPRICALADFKRTAEPAPEGVSVRADCVIAPGAHGVHDRDGEPLPETYFQRGPTSRIRHPYGAPQSIRLDGGEKLDELPSVVFLPFAHTQHFGHLLTETAAWLSAFLDPAIDVLGLAGPSAIVIVAAHSADVVPHLCRMFHLPPERVLTTAGLPRAVVGRRVFIPRPTMINRRWVGRRHFAAVRRLVDRWYDLPAETLADRLAAPAHREARDKVYLSRSRLPADVRHVVDENLLEEELSKTGWRVVYPEQLSLPDQLAALSSARVVAGNVGSPFHLLMYFGDDFARKTVIGLGMRRPEQDDVIYNYVFQFRQQPVDFLHLCCLREDRSTVSLKAGRNYRAWDVRLTAPPRVIARAMDSIAER